MTRLLTVARHITFDDVGSGLILLIAVGGAVYAPWIAGALL